MPPEQTVRAVVLLSGGVDSATVMAIAHAEGRELYALSFDYGQRHLRELESAKMVAEAFRVKKHLIVSFNLRDIGGSALTAEIDVPKAETKGLSKSQDAAASHADRLSIPVTYVPARNTIFLSFALGWAEVIGAEQIYIGANAVDYSGYPDCRPEYLESFEKMANLATRASVEGKMTFSIKAPLLYMSKAEIVKTGAGLGLDYSLTWSCYDPQPGKAQKSEVGSQKLKKPAAHARFQADFVPCGLCDSCRFREKGFREAGIRDPLTL
ncbi:MAG: 7-cyano-7-deazaguanine synthase QueC [Nitrospiraceae bacterium]|nr:MAG: 7-cyano-7-deazaguanine synthase QueC [Nitrospiraceae bacterium]